jgi:hypothetical protein
MDQTTSHFRIGAGVLYFKPHTDESYRMKYRKILLLGGWAIYIVSLFLPMEPFLAATIDGWKLIVMSSEIVFMLFKEVDIDSLAIIVFFLNNILMLLSPLIIFYIKRNKVLILYGIFIGLFTLFFCSYSLQSGGKILIGKYLWTLSFLLVTISLFMSRPEFYKKYK